MSRKTLVAGTSLSFDKLSNTALTLFMLRYKYWVTICINIIAVDKWELPVTTIKIQLSHLTETCLVLESLQIVVYKFDVSIKFLEIGLIVGIGARLVPSRLRSQLDRGLRNEVVDHFLDLMEGLHYDLPNSKYEYFLEVYRCFFYCSAAIFMRSNGLMRWPVSER